MTSFNRPACLLIGTPKGITRSVLEALLKKGSKVLFTCSDDFIGSAELKRLSSLYGSQRVFFCPHEQNSTPSLEFVFKKAVNKFGEIGYVVNSTATNSLKLEATDLQGDLRKVDRKLNRMLVNEDVKSIERMGRLTTRYMGKQNNLKGGVLLNITSSVELSEGLGGKCCTVLGTTRALGLAKNVASHGVKTVTVYQPSIDYPDLSHSTHITDDQHSPYSETSKYNSYIREYTGYMALHTGDTQAAGTAWAFNQQLRLEEVLPEHICGSCGIANKMCFWLGCPMVEEDEMTGKTQIVQSQRQKPSHGELEHNQGSN